MNAIKMVNRIIKIEPSIPALATYKATDIYIY